MLLGSENSAAAVALWLVTESQLPQFRAQLEPPAAAWLGSHGFLAERSRVISIPAATGGIDAAVAGLGALPDASQLCLWDGAACAERLPAGPYTPPPQVPGAAGAPLPPRLLLRSLRLH